MKGILFRPEMIKAIVEGKKTVTRRVIKELKMPPGVPEGTEIALNPRYFPGETVYIKEAWAAGNDYGKGKGFEAELCNIYPDESYEVVYKLDDAKQVDYWRSPMFLPERFARYFIQIDDVRPERLQEITEDDAVKEGAEDWEGLRIDHESKKYELVNDHLMGYELLWDSINKYPYDWASNPWVWRYQFHPVDKE